MKMHDYTVKDVTDHIKRIEVKTAFDENFETEVHAKRVLAVEMLLDTIEGDTFSSDNIANIREGLLDTPDRVARMYEEIFGGYKYDPQSVLGTQFEVSYDHMMIVRDISYWSHCEHHMVPFYGNISVGYIPRDNRVLGISKVVRLIEILSRRLQIQERLTAQIADELEKAINPLGIMVVADGTHLCMKMRGVKNPCADTVTSIIRGVFREEIDARMEFLALIKKN